jgi:hypothetical protein
MRHSYNKITLGYVMKKIINLLSLVVITLTLTACVQVQPEPKNNNQLGISSVRDLPVTYPQGSFFSLSPKYVKETSLKPKQTQAIYQIYTDSIINDLKANGFNIATQTQQAVFHVDFGIALSSDFSDEKINEKFGVSPGLTEKDDLIKGSFLISIEDAKTGHRVWRAIAQGFAQETITLEQREQRAAVIVANVMKQFYQSN